MKSLRQEPAAEAAQQASGATADVAEVPADGVVAYYFHSTFRCPTCQGIEAYAREAIETGFADALNDGRVRWRVLNYEKPENRSLARKYEIAMPMVVLVKLERGSEKSWKSLDRVWELNGNKREFIQYVQEEIHGYLERQ